jgi:hypothetical protein
MPDNITDNINIDVVLGDQSSTTVSPIFYPHDIAVSIPGVDGKDGPVGPVGGAGAEGPIGPDGTFTPDGPEGSVQFKATPSNTTIDFSGVSQFSFDKSTHFLTISGGGLIIDDGSVQLTGSIPEENKFLIKDGGSNVLKVDTENKKITFSETAAINEYYLGVGVTSPSERLHVGNGNLRVDGQIKAGGHIVPLASGQYDLGDASFPFRDLYIDGDSVYFVNSKTKISATKADGIKMVQTITGEGGLEEDRNIFSVSSKGISFTGAGGLTGDISYENITDGFLFVEKDLVIGDQNIPINFNTTLSYYPQIVANISVPEGFTDIYGVTVHSVENTGFYAALTAPVSREGYSVMAFVSPKISNENNILT